MVLGLKKKKGITFQVDYIVSVLEIKPWPPSVPLCSVQTVLIQWENGEQNSGFLPPGVPSLNGFEGGKIEFNEFFKLPVTLCTSGKNKDNNNESFQKNYLEFHLYEPRKDKAVKGQLLGSATINLAEYGIIKEGETINALITMKKTTKGMTPTFLSVKIQPFDTEGIQSVLRLMSEQCDNDSEILSDDDDLTSNSSRTPSVSDSSRNSHFQIDEVLNFVAVGLNSESSSPKFTQSNTTDDHQTKQDQVVQKEISIGTWNVPAAADTQVKNDNVESGNDEWNSVKPIAPPPERDVFSKFSEIATKQKSTLRSTTLKFGRKGLDLHGLKHMKSVRLPSDTLQISAPISVNNQPLETSTVTSIVKEEAPVETKVQEAKVQETSEIKKEKKSKKSEWEAKCEILEEELKESAAIEVSLYSAVAEHVNSTRKVHSPARRLSRFYRHACKAGPTSKRASASRTIVSGLVLVSKACGNDVSRLTFWLSNSIMLRAIVSQINKEPPPNEASVELKGKAKNKKSQQNNKKESQTEDEWEEPHTLIMALEKLEAWIFSRMIESLWWQSFTPHMQTIPTKKKGRRTARKTQAWRFCLGDQEQGSFSIDLWKKAFQDAWERLCPLRAAGHDCGCLPIPSKSVMEQLVDRLDVAMFNAVLRDSDEEMPTDPVSDPITDPKVLPIPSGKSSFGAGAQLKNAVGSWSSWLSDFFGDSTDDNESEENNRKEEEGSFKAFRLLNALSNLMMLPLGMLSDGSTRKEVCPLLGAPLIKRVLISFIPDDFSPDPVPESLLEALDFEDQVGASKEAINSFPCKANPVYYSPVPISQLSNMIGQPGMQDKQKGGSSILRKSYNSDDDLEKMNSPLGLIKVENIKICSASSEPNWMPQGKRGRSVVRYQLLQEVWKNVA